MGEIFADQGLRLRDVLLLVFLVFAVPASLFNPYVGILCWSWLGYFNPHQMTWGFAREIPVALLVAVPTLVGLVFTARRRLPPITLQTVLLLALWGWFCLTTLLSMSSPEFVHHEADTILRMKEISKILLMTFVSTMLVIDRKRLKWWYVVTAASFGFFVIKGALFGVLTGGQFRVYGPEGSMIGDNNDFALAVNMILASYICLIEPTTTPIVRWLARFSFLCAMASVVLTYSRGGLLGMSAVLMILALRSRRRIFAVGGIAIVGIALLMIAPQKWLNRMGTIENAAEVDASAQSRLRSWSFATKLAMDNPLFGGGFSTFTPELYAKYGFQQTSAEVRLEYGPHSVYFQMLGEHGFPGLLLFLVLLFGSIISCTRISRQFRRIDPRHWLVRYSNMVQCGLIGFAVSGTFLGRAYFDLYYQLIATVIILKALARQELFSMQAEPATLESATSSVDDYDEQPTQIRARWEAI